MARFRGGGPPTVVAVVALIAAVAGTALAGPVANTAKDKVTKREKRKMRKIATNRANKQISKLESGLNVNSAKSAGTASNADRATSARTAFSAGRADTAGVAGSAGNVHGAEAGNLVQGFATVEDGDDPAVRNFGGKRITGVAVDHAASDEDYTWTFSGEFAGVTPDQVGMVANTFDSDDFVWCAGDNDDVAVTASTLVLTTFCTPTDTTAYVSEVHTVQVFIAR